VKKLELVNDPAPMAPRPNTPPSLSSIIDYLVANRELLHGEQQATSLDAQKMIEAVEKTRTTVNKELDQLIEILRGTMHERMVSVETVIGGPS
jgi:iron-sulfur cluster repair protein YtfE (RIC family)